MICHLNNLVRTDRRKVIWIHCNYLPARLDKCLNLAETFLKRLGLLENALLVYVNNSLDQTDTQRHSAWLQLQGSNQAREFSAWQEGWNVVAANAHDVDIVILTNDTFPFHQPYYLLGLLLRSALRRLIRDKVHGFALGVVERGFDFESLPEYITSFFIVLDRQAAMSIMYRITTPVPEWSVADDATSGKIVLSHDKRYEESINRWLLNPVSHSWYAAAPLTRDNYPSMAGKARSIILEHSLSRHLRAEGIQLISCLDFPLGFLARWYMRIEERIRTSKWFAKIRIPE